MTPIAHTLRGSATRPTLPMDARKRARPSLLACALALPSGVAALVGACGGRVEVEGGEGGTGAGATSTTTTINTTTTGSGGTSTGGTTTGGYGAGGFGAGGAGGFGDCDAYLDESGSGLVTVRMRNDSGLPIFLPAHCGTVRYELASVPADGVEYAFDPFCLQTCEDLQTEGIIDCADCEPTSMLLPSGSTIDLLWEGTGLESTLMPGDCWAMGSGQGSCAQQVSAGAGSYRILATGFSSCGYGGSCACDSSGLCYGEATGLAAYADPAMFDLPTSFVEVVFGVCAFGCPEAS